MERGRPLFGGYTLALHNTLTVGVLSAEGRTLPESPVELQGALLQTDAAINPGSSGGPLLNSAGEVIGIATAIVPAAHNVGFAVPIHLAKRVIPDLIEMGHPYRPSLGIDGVEITPELADLFDLPRRTGFLVERVVPGSLAEKEGLRAGQRIILLNETAYVVGGDIITSIEGKEVSSASQIARALLESHPGEELRVTVLRDGVLYDFIEVRVHPPRQLDPDLFHGRLVNNLPSHADLLHRDFQRDLLHRPPPSPWLKPRSC